MKAKATLKALKNLKKTTFYKEHKYPSYEEVIEIIKSDLTLFSEYGEFNHTLLNKIWDEMGAKGNEEKIKL